MACDAGIYVRPQCGGMGSLYLILYVDDVTFFGSSMEDIEALKTALSTHFEMTDMGEISVALAQANVFCEILNKIAKIMKIFVEVNPLKGYQLLRQC